MNVLLVTDAFPPVSGGSGWSTYELARELRRRGHAVRIVQPVAGRTPGPARFDGFDVRQIRAVAPDVPLLRAYFKHERLTSILGPILRRAIRDAAIDIVHAQHVMSGPPAIAAAGAEGVPVVCTVRDYWPVCFWGTLIHDPASETLCPACTPAMMTRCVRPRAGRAWPLALGAIPYMRSNLRRKRGALAAADAIVAVSSAIARDLRSRAPELGAARIETIPNPVDVRAIRDETAGAARRLAAPYLLYAGKLAPNKGVAWLFQAVADAPASWPLVVVGDGPERAAMERAAAGAGREIVFTGWVARDEALAWMRHAEVLVFPSHGPESLSRVLLEASALGLAIAAMETGGTRDIITHGETGLVSETPDRLRRDVATLAADAELRRRLGGAAHERALTRFDARAVGERIERLYRELAGARGRAAP
jgi:glycosyltransferase involved in cell wall biosynthesis